MQFSRYIVVKAFCLNSEIWRFELQHLSSSPKEYWCEISLRKHHCSASLRKVCLFSNLRLRFRSSSLRKQCMGLSGLEPPTSRLSGVRSNRLSYKPLLLNFHQDSSFARFHQVLCGNTIISLRSMRCTIFLNSNFALLVLIKKCFGNTIASLRYARCTFSLRFKLRFARFHQVKNAAASTYSPIPSPV